MKNLVLAAAVAAALAASVAGAASASAPPLDEQWLRTAISGDRFEIAGGRIALQRSRDPNVRALAQQVMKDHAKSLQEMASVARRWGIGVPPAATPTMQWQLHNLRFLPQTRFDAEYASLEVKDHHQDIEETAMEAREGRVYEIRQLAWKTLPVLNMHLKLSKRTVDAVNARNAQ
jgi:putative membrane protein